MSSDAALVTEDSFDTLYPPDAFEDIDLNELYQIGAQIGRGGMAEVYAATDCETGEEVAVKCMIPGLSVHGRMRLRFANEIDILSRCRNPFVLAYHKSGHRNGIPAYVAERCTGSLYDLGAERPLPLSRVLRYASEVLVALDQVHAFGSVHRDIKPQNVLVGKDQHVRLADFGTALHPQCRITEAGHRVGTPAFSSPDMSANPRQASPEHDLFSVGILILVLATHLRPRALTDATERTRTLRLFPETTSRMLARATASSSSVRYRSAPEMVIAIQDALAQL